MPPGETMRLPLSVSDWATAGSYCKTPAKPWPTVTLRATAAVSIVTKVPSPIMAVSAAVGTIPQDQIAGLLQFPEAIDVQVTRGALGRAWGTGAHSSGSNWTG